MAEFNWDDLPDAPTAEEVTQTASFDWDSQPDAPAAEAKTDNSTSLGSKAKSFGAGVTQGASLGFGDELAGATAAAVEGNPITRRVYDYINKKYAQHGLGVEGAGDLPLASQENIADVYRGTRDIGRDVNMKTRAENPWSYGIGEFAGGMSATAPLAAPLSTVKGAAALGGTYGLGASDADLTKGEVGGALLDTGIGAGLGAGTAGATKFVTEKIPGMRNKAANYFSRKAEERNIKDMHMTLGEGTKRILRSPKGQRVDPATGRTKLHELSRDLIDEGVTGKSSLLKHVDELDNRAIQSMKYAKEAADQSGVTNVNVKDIADELTAKYGMKSAVKNDLEKVKTVLREMGDDISPNQAWDLRKDLDLSISYNRDAGDIPMKEVLIRDARGLINQKMHAAYKEIAEAAGDPSIYQRFAEGNKQYSLARSIEKPATKPLFKGNFEPDARTISYGGSTMWSDIKNTASAGVGKVANVKNMDFVAKTLKTNPQMFGKFAPVLQKAMATVGGVPAVSYVLSQNNPEYREILRQLNGQEADEQ